MSNSRQRNYKRRHKGATVRRAQPQDTFDNRLLAALPKVSRERLLAKSQRVTLTVKDIVYHPGDTITAVYFPLTCVVSMMTEM